MDIQDALSVILKADPQKVIALVGLLGGRESEVKVCWVDFEICPYDFRRNGLLDADATRCRNCSRLTSQAEGQIQDLQVEELEEQETVVEALTAVIDTKLATSLADYLRRLMRKKTEKEKLPINLSAALEVVINELELDGEELEIVPVTDLEKEIDRLSAGETASLAPAPNAPFGPPQPFAGLQAALDREKAEKPKEPDEVPF